MCIISAKQAPTYVSNRLVRIWRTGQPSFPGQPSLRLIGTGLVCVQGLATTSAWAEYVFKQPLQHYAETECMAHFTIGKTDAVLYPLSLSLDFCKHSVLGRLSDFRLTSLPSSDWLQSFPFSCCGMAGSHTQRPSHKFSIR